MLVNVTDYVCNKVREIVTFKDVDSNCKGEAACCMIVRASLMSQW